MMSVCHIDNTGCPQVPLPAGRYLCPYTGTMTGTWASMRRAVPSADESSSGRGPPGVVPETVVFHIEQDPVAWPVQEHPKRGGVAVAPVRPGLVVRIEDARFPLLWSGVHGKTGGKERPVVVGELEPELVLDAGQLAFGYPILDRAH